MSHLSLHTKGIIENPAVAFVKNAKAGVYDSISDEEYKVELQDVEQEADLFEQKKNASSAHLFIRAYQYFHQLSSTSILPVLHIIPLVVPENAASLILQDA